MTGLFKGVKEGFDSLCRRVCYTMTGQMCEDKEGMEILQFIVIAAIVAVVLGLVLPPLSRSLQDSNQGTIDSINTLQETVLNGS